MYSLMACTKVAVSPPLTTGLQFIDLLNPSSQARARRSMFFWRETQYTPFERKDRSFLTYDYIVSKLFMSSVISSVGALFERLLFGVWNSYCSYGDYKISNTFNLTGMIVISAITLKEAIISKSSVWNDKVDKKSLNQMLTDIRNSGQKSQPLLSFYLNTQVGIT